MNAKELRIGNYVKDRGKKVIRIDFLEHIQDGYDTKFGQLVYLEGTEVHPMTEYSEFANPIPLTEKWLLNFGFEKVEDLGDMIYYQIINKRRGFGVELNHDEWVFYLYNNIDYTPLIYNEPHFKYVHQLQNLYFALTGKELTQELT